MERIKNFIQEIMTDVGRFIDKDWVSVSIAAACVFAAGYILAAGSNVSWDISAAVIIAVISLVATIYHSLAVRKHNRLQVRPILQCVISGGLGDNAEAPLFSISLKNVGLGPALVEEITLFRCNLAIGGYEGVQRLTSELVEKYNVPINNIHFSSKDGRMIIPSGEEHEILTISMRDIAGFKELEPDTKKHVIERTKVLSNELVRTIYLKASYQSIYKEELYSVN